MRPIFRLPLLALLTLPGPARPEAFDLGTALWVDLSHAFNADTLYWPTSPSAFQLQQLARGQTDAGYFYSANAFCTPEHGGTHLDAPIHFAEQGQTLAQLPLRRLAAPAAVIDISAAAAADADYRLSVDDVVAFEGQHGPIAAGTTVLLRTGWSVRWPDAKSYLGDDTPGDASRLHFPSYGEEAARLLLEQRGVTMLGVDTASIDHGQSQDFPVHRIAAARDVPALENLTGLEQLPPTGSFVIALPMKIEGGSGGPVRVVALLPGG